jgi:hypothetical protein
MGAAVHAFCLERKIAVARFKCSNPVVFLSSNYAN